MKKIIVASAIFCSAIIANAQNFNGSIEFTNANTKDTTKNVYYVKDKIVKLDNYDKKNGGISGSFIFDFNTNVIRWVNPKRKVWGTSKSETPPIILGTCEVTKGATKKIQNINCTEYVVKNKEENTIITYWITTEKFTFFAQMIKLWNRKDKQSIYYGKIEGLPEGSMPLLSEEKHISDAKMMSRLEVTKINKTAPDDASLQVPAGYNKFDQ